MLHPKNINPKKKGVFWRLGIFCHMRWIILRLAVDKQFEKEVIYEAITTPQSQKAGEGRSPFQPGEIPFLVGHDLDLITGQTQQMGIHILFSSKEEGEEKCLFVTRTAGFELVKHGMVATSQHSTFVGAHQRGESVETAGDGKFSGISYDENVFLRKEKICDCAWKKQEG